MVFGSKLFKPQSTQRSFRHSTMTIIPWCSRKVDDTCLREVGKSLTMTGVSRHPNCLPQGTGDSLTGMSRGANCSILRDRHRGRLYNMPGGRTVGAPLCMGSRCLPPRPRDAPQVADKRLD